MVPMFPCDWEREGIREDYSMLREGDGGRKVGWGEMVHRVLEEGKKSGMRLFVCLLVGWIYPSVDKV